MAITNYGELKAALSSEIFHERFVSDYDNKTQIFEAAANRRLRVRQMEASTLLTTDAGDVALPIDYLVWRTVLAPGSTMPDAELEYVHPAYLPPSSTRGTVGSPQVFTIEADTLRIRPTNDATDYEFHYYCKIPTIAGSNIATNWLLTAYPDVYLFGVLVELAAKGRNLEMAQLYKARRDELFAEIIQLSALTTGATSPQVRVSEYF